MPGSLYYFVQCIIPSRIFYSMLLIVESGLALKCFKPQDFYHSSGASISSNRFHLQEVFPDNSGSSLLWLCGDSIIL